MVFCEFCVEEVVARNRQLGCLNSIGYKNLQKKFFDRTRRKHDKRRLKNNWEALKEEHNLCSNDLREKATELGWVHKKGAIDAFDAWWKEHNVVIAEISIYFIS